MTAILLQIVQFYIFLIIIYVLLSWFPAAGIVADVRHALGFIIEPYLGLFRRIVPSVGMLDISPIVAILVLQWVLVPIITMIAPRL